MNARFLFQNLIFAILKFFLKLTKEWPTCENMSVSLESYQSWYKWPPFLDLLPFISLVPPMSIIILWLAALNLLVWIPTQVLSLIPPFSPVIFLISDHTLSWLYLFIKSLTIFFPAAITSFPSAGHPFQFSLKHLHLKYLLWRTFQHLKLSVLK